MNVLDAEKLTSRQVAAMLGLASSTVAGWRHQGIGPKYVRFNGAVRYLRADVEAWVSAQNSAD